MAGKDPLPRKAAKILHHAFVHGKIDKGTVHEFVKRPGRKVRDIVNLLMAKGFLKQRIRKVL